MKLGDVVARVIGVDSHKDVHVAAVVEAPSGRVVAHESAQASQDGYDALVGFADLHSSRDDRVWAIEGTGSYGAGLTAVLAARGERVIEIDRPSRPSKRNGAKSDELDAVRAAREALARDHHAEPRARGEREALRVVLTTRASAVECRKRAITQLKANVVTAPEALRAELDPCSTTELVRTCADLDETADGAGEDDDEWCYTVRALGRLARRILDLDAEIAEHNRDVEHLTETMCPSLLAEPGVGPVTAAQAILAWSHSGRCRHEAAFANLAGVAPIEASSGKTIRHRLNRGGDRSLNRALHTIVLSRTKNDEATRAYIARRTSEGKTPREARRCLKRYIARRIYRILEANAANQQRPQQGLDAL